MSALSAQLTAQISTVTSTAQQSIEDGAMNAAAIGDINSLMASQLPFTGAAASMSSLQVCASHVLPYVLSVPNSSTSQPSPYVCSTCLPSHGFACDYFDFQRMRATSNRSHATLRFVCFCSLCALQSSMLSMADRMSRTEAALSRLESHNLATCQELCTGGTCVNRSAAH